MSRSPAAVTIVAIRPCRVSKAMDRGVEVKHGVTSGSPRSHFIVTADSISSAERRVGDAAGRPTTITICKAAAIVRALVAFHDPSAAGDPSSHGGTAMSNIAVFNLEPSKIRRQDPPTAGMHLAIFHDRQATLHRSCRSQQP